jgi:adenylate cyclase
VAATDTIVFTDLAGFTEYTDVRGDAAALALLDQQATMLRQALANSGGRLVKELGDGLMLWFSHPVPALEAAISMLAAIEKARDERAFPLGVRIGMHSGDLLPRGDDFVGQTVNIAARVVDLAGPDELLATDAVVAEAGEASFQPIGPARVKGVAAAVWLHRLQTAR